MKRVVLEFYGGCWEGHSLDSGSDDPDERKLAHGLYFKTGDGAIGQAIKELTPQARQFSQKQGWTEVGAGPSAGESYQVVERVDEAERIIVKLRHHGP